MNVKIKEAKMVDLKKLPGKANLEAENQRMQTHQIFKVKVIFFMCIF